MPQRTLENKLSQAVAKLANATMLIVQLSDYYIIIFFQAAINGRRFPYITWKSIVDVKNIARLDGKLLAGRVFSFLHAAA